jgi:enolase
MKIVKIIGRQIFDSRGFPTVEADVWLEFGVFGRAAVPSGASTGVHEAHELRDGLGPFSGKGVQKAVDNINGVISTALKGLQADDQFLVDQRLIELDNTDNKSRLGANAILAVSLAVAHAAAKSRGLLLYRHINDIAHGPEMSLPMPMMNILNGGKHALESSDFQEFMIIPKKAEDFQEVMQIGSEIFQSLKGIIASKGMSTAVGDEGGFTYPVRSNTEMLDLLMQSCSEAGYTPGLDVLFATDVAASEFYENGKYHLKTEDRDLSADEMISYFESMIDKYPIISIEDGLNEDDWEGWQKMTEKLGKLQIVGDDLLVTNTERLGKAINLKAGNTILIKPNQIGTLTETISAIKIAKEHGWRTVVSHRSGETEDVTIAHLAIGTGAGQIKTGSLSRSERIAKYNELLRLEEIDSSLKLSNPFI